MAKSKIDTNPIKFTENLWAYPSRSGDSLEFYVRGFSEPSAYTTHSFRLSFKKLKEIERVIRVTRG